MARWVIGLIGYAGAGKDCAAEALMANGFVRVSFADPLRKALLAVNPLVPELSQDLVSLSTAERLSEQIQRVGWDSCKRHNPEVRNLLQRLGTEAGRDIHGQDCWTDLAANSIEDAFASGAPGVVITDCRFENEIRMLHRLAAWDGNRVRFVRISRTGVGPVNAHVSDARVGEFKCDVEISNDSTIADLHKRILGVVGL